MKRFIANERRNRENRGKDPVQMDMRVRRSDELFLIHREPVKGETDPVHRKTANRKAKEPRAEDDDLQYKIPPMDREFENTPMGEYLLPAEKEEIEKLRPELERQTNYTPRTMEEVITAQSQQEHATEEEEENSEEQKQSKRERTTNEGSSKHLRRRGARERKPPNRLQMPDWRN